MRGSIPLADPNNQPALGEEPLLWGTYLVLRFLQGLFNHLPEGSYHWEPDKKTTEIIITDQATVESEVVQKRPAILVTRGPAQFANLALDQLMSMNLMTGQRVHSDLISGNFTLQCVGGNGVEAQHVAWLAMRGLVEYKRLLLKYWQLEDEDGEPMYTFGFHKIAEPPMIGSETAPGSVISGAADHEYILVPIQVPYYLQWTWRVTPTSPSHKETLGLFLEKDRAVEADKPEFDRAEGVRVNYRIAPSSIYGPNGRRIRVGEEGEPIQTSDAGPGGPAPIE